MSIFSGGDRRPASSQQQHENGLDGLTELDNIIYSDIDLNNTVGADDGESSPKWVFFWIHARKKKLSIFQHNEDINLFRVIFRLCFQLHRKEFINHSNLPEISNFTTARLEWIEKHKEFHDDSNANDVKSRRCQDLRSTCWRHDSR